jgi:hypothetical protein
MISSSADLVEERREGMECATKKEKACWIFILKDQIQWVQKLELSAKSHKLELKCGYIL